MRLTLSTASLHWVVTLSASATMLDAQVPTRAPGHYVYEYDVVDRWLTSRQQARFTPFRQVRSWIHVEERQLDSATQNMTLRVGFEPSIRIESGSITFGREGQIVSARGIPRAVRPLAGRAVDTVDLRTSNYFEEPPVLSFTYAPRLALPETRLWELVPMVRAARLERGARWTDTLALSTSADGFSQSLAGVRVSVMRGDTIVDGRQLWIVDDSARVRSSEWMLDGEVTSGSPITVERNTEGIIRGRYLFDPSLRMWRSRSDTMALAGTATLRYEDGRAFTTPVRFERRRTWTLFEREGFLIRQAQMRAERERTRGGMVISTPPDSEQSPTQRRLARGDGAFRDSLIGVWERSQDPTERQQLYTLLWTWGARGDPSLRSLLERRAIQAGDTVFWLDALTRSSPVPWDVPTVRDVLLPLMADPAAAWSLGISRDRFIQSAAWLIFSRLPAITRDTATWALSPAVYELLGQQWNTARDPRVRDLGLAALFVRDPRRWADTVLARAPTGSRLLGPAVLLARGVGATWPAASKALMPASGAAWREWLEWMGGRSPDYPVPASIAARNPPRYPELRFDDSHARAIRFYQLRTGRDVIGELRRDLAAATDDSARLVLSTILRGVGELAVDPREIATQLVSGSPALIALAKRTLPALFADAARAAGGFVPGLTRTIPVSALGGVTLADSALIVALIDRWIAARFALESPWPTIADRAPPAARPLPAAPLPPPPPGFPPPPTPVAPQRITISVDGIPAAVREKWQGRVSFITPAEWSAQNQREQSRIYRIAPIMRAGPFVVVTVDYTERMNRTPAQAPALYAGGGSVYLMELNGEWIIVVQSQWVT